MNATVSCDAKSSPGTSERQALLARLLDSVKQCQIRFGGRTELATEDDARVSTLCTSFETALQHGLRHPSKHRAAIKHVSEIVTAGLNLNLKGNEKCQVFWHFVREFLTRHEQERYAILKNVSTDLGRGRAWLRSSLNEHSLERYMHMFLGDVDHINHYYEDWAFMKDQESSCMLPNMAAGLSSILFAINIDNIDLNQPAACKRGLVGDSQAAEADTSEPCPVFANIPTEKEAKEKRRKRRVPLQIVSFDDDNVAPNGTRLVINVTACNSAPPSCLPSPNNSSSNAGFREIASRSSQSSLDNLLSQSAQGYLSDTFMNHAKRRDGYHLNPEESSQASNSDVDWSEATDIVTNQQGPYSNPLPETIYTSKGNSQSSAERVPERKRGSDVCIKDTKTPLTPINDSSIGELFPMTNNEDVHSDDSVSIPSFSEDADNTGASSAVARKLISQHNAVIFNDTCRAEKVPKSLVNNFQSEKFGTTDILNNGDFKSAVMTTTQKRDELVQENRSLRCLLDKEMEQSSALRLERDECEKKQQEKFQKVQLRLQAVSRENELLKHQLKKYVGAVQMLKRDGSQAHETLASLTQESMGNSAESRYFIDYHWEAIEYERKLVQVAEMHGELMEFNERLHRLVSQKESMVRRLREELIDLRGPLPDENQTSDDDISITSDYDNSSMTAAVRALINIWIPSVFLTGRSSDVHHVYQIYIRIRDDEWNVYRRYAQFYALHKELKRKEQAVAAFDFPPKKVLGNKDSKFVEERRKRLQHYLRCVVNLAVQCNSELICNPDKETFVTVLPFFGEYVKNSGRTRTPRNSFFFSHTPSQSQSSEVAATQHYTGL